MHYNYATDVADICVPLSWRHTAELPDVCSVGGMPGALGTKIQPQAGWPAPTCHSA